jgi:hypothetical protein
MEGFMVRSGKKGAALIVAVFTVLILFIISSGILFLLRRSVDDMAEKRTRMKLFYAAEGGLNHGLRRLRLASINEFASGSVPNLNGYSIDIGGIPVSLSASHSSIKGWTISALASGAVGNMSVSNTLSEIRSTGLSANAVAMASDMNSTLEFASGNPNDPGQLTSSQDMIIGSQYFGGLLNMEGMPVFDGIVTSASRTRSYRQNEAGQSWYNNGKNYTDILREIETGRYFYGIWDKSDGNSYKEDNAKMSERLAQVFPSGYNGNQDEVDFINNVAESYNDIKNLSNTNLLPTGYTAAEVTVRDDNTVVVKYGTETEKFVITSTSNIFAFPKNYKTVTFNESVINSDVSFVLEEGSAVIKGDIYYKGIENGLDDRNKAWGVNRGNIDDLRSQISGLSQTFGIIAYKGNITIDSTVGDSQDEILNDQLLLNGAFYCPRGQFGANDKTNAQKFKGSKRVINVGSVMMDSKGLYRSGTSGVTCVLTGDPRLEIGRRPLGFKQLLVYNQSDGQYYIVISDQMKWSSRISGN